MFHKNEELKPILDENDFEIEYNEEDDIIPEKTKSLTQFPLKLLSKEDFSDIEINKSYSKSLNFNFSKCFAPKQAYRHSNKNPSPIFSAINHSNINNLEYLNKGEALTDFDNSLDAESSNNSDSYDYYDKNSELKQINLNDNNFIISDKLLNQIDDRNEIIENNSQSKHIKYQSITFYHKKNLKSFRNSLFKMKLKSAKFKNKEEQHYLKENIKKKYGLDIQNKIKKKSYLCNDIKIIPINEINNDNENMNKFRKTIGFNMGKNNSKNEEKRGITVYDALINKKNKF
jgi:hypothetical protein